MRVRSETVFLVFRCSIFPNLASSSLLVSVFSLTVGLPFDSSSLSCSSSGSSLPLWVLGVDLWAAGFRTRTGVTDGCELVDTRAVWPPDCQATSPAQNLLHLLDLSCFPALTAGSSLSPVTQFWRIWCLFWILRALHLDLYTHPQTSMNINNWNKYFLNNVSLLDSTQAWPVFQKSILMNSYFSPESVLSWYLSTESLFHRVLYFPLPPSFSLTRSYYVPRLDLNLSSSCLSLSSTRILCVPSCRTCLYFWLELWDHVHWGGGRIGMPPIDPWMSILGP